MSEKDVPGIAVDELLRIFTGTTDYQDRVVADIHPWPIGQRPPERGDYIALDRPVEGARVFEVLTVASEWAKITPKGYGSSERLHATRLDRVEQEGSE